MKQLHNTHANGYTVYFSEQDYLRMVALKEQHLRELKLTLCA